MAADLHKVHDLTPMEKIEAFLNRHALFFLMLSFITLCILIMLLIYAVFGASFTGTDANAYYYHMGDII